jgi:hypothetical protein
MWDCRLPISTGKDAGGHGDHSSQPVGAAAWRGSIGLVDRASIPRRDTGRPWPLHPRIRSPARGEQLLRPERSGGHLLLRVVRVRAHLVVPRGAADPNLLSEQVRADLPAARGDLADRRSFDDSGGSGMAHGRRTQLPPPGPGVDPGPRLLLRDERAQLVAVMRGVLLRRVPVCGSPPGQVRAPSATPAVDRVRGSRRAVHPGDGCAAPIGCQSGRPVHRPAVPARRVPGGGRSRPGDA